MEARTIVASYVYEGFGKIVGQNGGSGGPYQFCGLWGYRNDGDAGLMHVGARYYEFETGRWVQKDPLLNLNLYIYCLNNPVNFIDPLGTTAIKPLLVIVAIVAIVIIVISNIGKQPSVPALPSCPRGYPMNPEEGRGTGCPDPHCPNETPGCCVPDPNQQQDQQPRTQPKTTPYSLSYVII